MTTHSHPHHRNHAVIALDVGARRIGVAVARLDVRLAHPLTTVERGPGTLQKLQDIAEAEGATMVVVGLPRNLSGDATAQTAATEAFAADLKQALGLPLHWQDEAVTSKQAEAELNARGKAFSKGDIDALSAVYILEDFLRDNPEVKA